MKQRILLLALGLAISFCALQANAQTAMLIPSKPTSADSLIFSIDLHCAEAAFKANAYRVKMVQNNIAITLGELQTGLIFPGVCPPSPMVEVELGKLPAGDYTLSMTRPAQDGLPERVYFSNFAFTVTDARLQKVFPWVRLDYSGHWWDPNDSGWGLFIWHDARDRILAAWFTYGTDGKPIWYVFQPTWEDFATTASAAISQTSRMPGPTSPPPNPTSYTTVGTASLDFRSIPTVTGQTTFDAGKLTYTFAGGQTIVRNIQRFK